MHTCLATLPHHTRTCCEHSMRAPAVTATMPCPRMSPSSCLLALRSLFLPIFPLRHNHGAMARTLLGGNAHRCFLDLAPHSPSWPPTALAR
jgi:hypothetical protein